MIIGIALQIFITTIFYLSELSSSVLFSKKVFDVDKNVQD